MDVWPFTHSILTPALCRWCEQPMEGWYDTIEPIHPGCWVEEWQHWHQADAK